MSNCRHACVRANRKQMDRRRRQFSLIDNGVAWIMKRTVTDSVAAHGMHKQLEAGEVGWLKEVDTGTADNGIIDG